MAQDWSASAVTLEHPVLVADIEDHFAEVDYRVLFNSVLDHRQVDFPVALQALDDILGDIADPYASEDDD
jgi:hypothetical protein